MDAIEQATGEREIDLVAYCLGGTLSALALAYLQATGKGDRVASATLIATLIDFESMGDWSVFLDESSWPPSAATSTTGAMWRPMTSPSCSAWCAPTT
jgi:poly(3-hydroxyalkanoate) synthetase